MEQFLRKKKQVHVGASTCARQTDLDTVYQAQNLQNPKNPLPPQFAVHVMPTITLTGTEQNPPHGNSHPTNTLYQLA
jgi:hypothetical protein